MYKRKLEFFERTFRVNLHSLKCIFKNIYVVLCTARNDRGGTFIFMKVYPNIKANTVLQNKILI